MASSPSGPPVKTGACPCVADLLDYALGAGSAADRQRVEAHLQGTGCGYCRAWIAKAGDAPKAEAAAPGKWHRREAFDELQRRLEQLEES